MVGSRPRPSLSGPRAAHWPEHTAPCLRRLPPALPVRRPPAVPAWGGGACPAATWLFELRHLDPCYYCRFRRRQSTMASALRWSRWTPPRVWCCRWAAGEAAHGVATPRGVLSVAPQQTLCNNLLRKATHKHTTMGTLQLPCGSCAGSARPASALHRVRTWTTLPQSLQPQTFQE